MKTMKKLLFLILILFTTGCTEPILDYRDYEVIDTLNVNRNGFGTLMGYDVIIKIDTSYFYGYIDKKSMLLGIGRKIHVERLK